jgi:hypothetical protein
MIVGTLLTIFCLNETAERLQAVNLRRVGSRDQVLGVERPAEREQDCYSVHGLTDDICHSAVPDSPAVVATSMTQADAYADSCYPMCSSSVALADDFFVDVKAIANYVTRVLVDNGHVVSFIGTASGELLITSLPEPNTVAIPRQYYQVRVIASVINGDSYRSGRTMLVDASVVSIVRDESRTTFRNMVAKDCVAAAIETGIIRMATYKASSF